MKKTNDEILATWDTEGAYTERKRTMTRAWKYNADQMIYEAGNDWLEYGRFGADTYGLHTTLDGKETIIRIDAESGKEATEDANKTLDKIENGWRAANWSEDYYTVKEAAELLNVSRQRVHQLIQSGQLEGCKVGKTWYVYRHSVKSRLNA